MDWRPGTSPSSALFVIRLRWLVVVAVPVLLFLSPIPFDGFMAAVLGLFTAGTVLLHLRYLKLNARGRWDRAFWLTAFVFDLVLITAVVYFRAGIWADIYNLYFVAIIQSALFFGMAEALLTSVSSGTLYTIAIWLSADDLADVHRALIRAVYLLLIGLAAAYLATAEKKALILSLTDFKTRLPNFRHFHQSLQQAVSQHLRSGVPLTVAILDCDNFKALNAAIGHPGADQVLEQLAELLNQHKRQSDLLARYGGEEFVMFLPGVGHQQALAVLERFRTLVAEHPFKVEGLTTPLYITISIGAAVLPDNAATERELLVWADAALNSAKEAGKNRCLLSNREAHTQVG